MQSKMRIPQFYENQKIFITGGTGFMGKVLIEKLLRSCPDLSTIYVLIRSKKSKPVGKRLQDLLNVPLFDHIKETVPERLQKLVAIAGDVSEPNLGLTNASIDLLRKNVTIIFHVAASVRFDDTLKRAVNLNTRATYELVKIAKQMPDLIVFLHVSTTYTVTDRPDIDEKLYPCPVDWKKTLEIVDHFPEPILNILTSKYKGYYPNTYTLSKAMSEHVIYDELNNIVPCVIFRPSIVIASLHEPVKGWVDNFNGPVGMLVASGKGIMRSLYANPKLIADYIPVDIAIKAIIVAAWSKAIESSLIKEVTIADVIEMGKQISHDYPLNNILWMPGGSATDSKVLHYSRVLLTHLLPSIIIDAILQVLGQKPMLMKIQRKIFYANQSLKYFVFNQWKFQNSNCLKLNQAIAALDFPDWNYDFRHEEPYAYFENCALGARKYLLHEHIDTLEQAKSHYRRMKYLHYVIKYLLTFAILYAFFNKFIIGN